MKEKIKKYITKWKSSYPNGIPDEAPTRLEQLGKSPSYRLICKAILKNDYQCETLGFSKVKTVLYSDLKKIELKNKGVIKQIDIFK
jgi:predicted phosphoadenosine phosphosulfate sulfurtransferase